MSRDLEETITETFQSVTFAFTCFDILWLLRSRKDLNYCICMHDLLFGVLLVFLDSVRQLQRNMSYHHTDPKRRGFACGLLIATRLPKPLVVGEYCEYWYMKICKSEVGQSIANQSWLQLREDMQREGRYRCELGVY